MMKKLTIVKARNILTHHLTSLGYKEKTIKNYARKIGRFFNYLTETEGIHDIRDVNEQVLKRFFTWLNEVVSERTQKPLKASTKREIHSVIKLLFRGLYVCEFILINPMQHVVYKLKESPAQREILTENEMNRFLDGIDEEKLFGPRDKALFELMYSSGLRAGDITNLNVDDVDFEGRMVLLREGKFSKDRIVPISRVAAVFLKQYLTGRRRKTNILFTSFRGRRTSVSAINKRCKKWMKESGVYRKGLCTHCIRHSTAVHLLSHGADLRYVQELLGHESIETTVTYTHDLHENIRRVYKSFHPRENSYFQEVNEVYLERLQRFKAVLSKKKRISRKKRETKRRFYERTRDTLLEKMRRKYQEEKKKKKDLTKE